MYSNLVKNGQLYAIVVGVFVTLVFLVSVIMGLSNSGYSVSDDLVQIMKTNPDQKFDFFNPGLALSVGLIVITAVAALLFGIFQLVSNPKNSVKAIVSVGALVAIFFGLYATSDADTSGAISQTILKFEISENVSKLISGALKTSLILAVLAIIGMIVFEIYNMFK